MKPKRTFCIICLDGSGQPLTKRSDFIFAIMASARTFRGCLFDGRTRRSVILDCVVLYKFENVIKNVSLRLFHRKEKKRTKICIESTFGEFNSCELGVFRFECCLLLSLRLLLNKHF